MQLNALKAAAQTIGEGASSDIWYDAKDHGDTAAETRIDEVQAAMALVSESMDHLLLAATLVQKLQSAEGNVTIKDGILTFENGECVNLSDLQFKADELPAAVVEVQGGLINRVVSSVPMRVVILDTDTEGADEASVLEVNGNEVYVFDMTLDELVENGCGGIDPAFVADVLSQVQSAA